MKQPLIVFVDRASIPSHIHLSEPEFAHQWINYDNTSPDVLLQRVQHAEIIVTNKVIFDAAVLDQLPRLRLLAVTATGVNNIDIDYCREHDIAVANIQGYATRSVPEHVIGMMFALRRNLMAYHQDIARGVWQQSKQFCFFTHPIGDIAGRTMGIVGSGTLGQATAKLAKALGMQVIFAERKERTACRNGFIPFNEVLQQADVLTLHCPLVEATRDLIGLKELEMMKSDAILINTGRGGLVNEQALVDALSQGTIAGAGVDVFTQEPADLSNPLLAHHTLPNLLMTPHIAWGSDSAIEKLVDILIGNINAFMRGERQNRIV